jgi:hypothetical protein
MVVAAGEAGWAAGDEPRMTAEQYLSKHLEQGDARYEAGHSCFRRTISAIAS